MFNKTITKKKSHKITPNKIKAEKIGRASCRERV